MDRRAFFAAAAATLSLAAMAAETNETQLANLSAVEAWKEATERGLKIDAAAGEVLALAEFCGIDPNATVEFPIVGELSDRDYEAVFRTFAKPGSIARALESLGVPRGRNVDPATMNFWPYGSRVEIDVAPFAATNRVWTPIQNYIVDMSTRAPLAYKSFVYCGSRDAEDFAPGARLCDAAAPNSVFSTYNEPQTLIDMPARCAQGDVYERFLLAPGHGLAPYGLYLIRIRPARDAGGNPIGSPIDVDVEIVKGGGGIEYWTREGCVCEHYTNAADFVEFARASAGKGNPLFATVGFGDALTLDEAIAQARLISQIEGESGIRVMGPTPAGIYYKGFLPSEAWRVRGNRPAQPWEIRFGEPGTNGVRRVRLVKTIEDWTSTDSLDPILSTEEYWADSPEEAAATMASHDDGLPVVLAFAPGSAALREVMPTIRALRAKHPTVYLFAE